MRAQSPVFTVGHRYTTIGGLSVIPVKRDGSKAPTLPEWKQYQEARATIDDCIAWWDSGKNGCTPGIGIIGGKVSGGLCIIDLESGEIFESWKRKVSADDLARCVIVKTPKGYHVYFRSDLEIGCRKLARKDAKTTLIETKAEGGYVIAPGSPAECHPLKREYVLVQGDLCNIAKIDDETAEQFLSAAEELNEYVEPPRTYQNNTPSRNGDRRPGDHFDAYVSWDDVLKPHGWKPSRGRGVETRWRRPGGKHYTSAVTNHFAKDELIVFSTEAQPFETERAYTKFAAYTLLNFAGDFRASAKYLAGRGYGK